MTTQVTSYSKPFGNRLCPVNLAPGCGRRANLRGVRTTAVDKIRWDRGRFRETGQVLTALGGWTGDFIHEF